MPNLKSYEAVSVLLIKKDPFTLRNWFLEIQYTSFLSDYETSSLCKIYKIIAQYIPISRYLIGLF